MTKHTSVEEASKMYEKAEQVRVQTRSRTDNILLDHGKKWFELAVACATDKQKEKAYQ